MAFDVPLPVAGTVPPIQGGSDVWDLGVQPHLLNGAGGEWRLVSLAMSGKAADVNNSAMRVLSGSWEGSAADAFDGVRRALVSDLYDAAEQATKVAAALDNMAATMRAAQRAADTAWQSVASIPSRRPVSGLIEFAPRTEAESAALAVSIEACRAIREDLDTALGACQKDISTAYVEMRMLASAWQDEAAGTVPPFELPPEADGPGVIVDGDRVIVNAGRGNDEVKVHVNPRSGEQVVIINGKQFKVAASADLVVRAGPGNDTVVVDAYVDKPVTLLGGAGDDTIVVRRGSAPEDGDPARARVPGSTILGLGGHDRLFGGRYADFISGGSDRDYIDGGAGNDTIGGGLGSDTAYGLGGNDTIEGGEGRDYLEGGAGDDVLLGGLDGDVLSAGRGNDVVRGGGGADVSYAGLGADTVDGGRGADTGYSEAADRRVGVETDVEREVSEAAEFIRTDHQPGGFRDRVEADLDMLRASPSGQQMLAALDQAYEDSGGRETLHIVEYPSPDNSRAVDLGPGLGNRIEYNPYRDRGVGGDFPPVRVLYHELAHVYDFTHGTRAPGVYEGADNPGVPNEERAVVGLPLDDGELYEHHPYELTENAFRDEMGWPRREFY